MKVLNIALILFLSSIGFAQDFAVSTVTPLSATVSETSGLIWLENELLTHNDSGGEHFLYKIDTIDGSTSDWVVIPNAGNVDWEDICYDDEYIYVGDFGNNSGSRTNLRIYRISIDEYLTTLNDTVYCDTINFSYADQVDFTPTSYSTNYDAEAIIAYNDSLYIFTKNWGNNQTNVYSVPKTPGTYSVSIIDNMNPLGLITGAAYNAENNEILLTGYTFPSPFLYLIKSFSGNNFSAGSQLRVTPTFEGSFQIEGVTHIDDHSYFVSSEMYNSSLSILHRVDISNFDDVSISTDKKIKARIYPQTVNDILYIEADEAYGITVYNMVGEIVKTGFGNKIDLSNLKTGAYIVTLTEKSGIVLKEKILKL